MLRQCSLLFGLPMLVAGSLLAIAAQWPSWGRSSPGGALIESSSCAAKTGGDSQSAHPILEVPGGLSHDFGALAMNTAGRHVFEIRNVGTAELTLELAGTSCGCTTVSLNGKQMLSVPLVHSTLPGFLLPNSISLAELVEKEEDTASLLAVPPDEPLPDVGLRSSVLKVSSNRHFEDPAIDSFKSDLPPIPELLQTSEEGVFRLAPGGTAMVEVAWKTGVVVGPFRQSTRLISSDPQRPAIELVVSGQVTVPEK